MKILIAGDYCDIGRVSELIRQGDYHFLSEELTNYISNFDFSIVNFEFPIVLTKASQISKIGPCLSGNLKSIDAIKSMGFNVCTLANNHILDQGEQCCLDTIMQLREKGFKTIGAGKNISEANDILYLCAKDVKVAIINCCEHEFSIATDSRAGANPLNPIRQYYSIQEARENADFVIVIIHGGHEFFHLPSPRMKELYRFFIDAGANVVVNHHQHCYSGYEKYDGNYIFYGLGNFLFDGQFRNSSWNEGYLLGLVLEKNNPIDYSIIPYEQCNELPSVELMKGDKLDSFMHEIKKINKIIGNDLELTEMHRQWMEKNSSFMPALFEPWQDKYTSFLYRHGLLPTTFKKDRRLKLINYIWCESHLDRLRYVFRDS